jgi:DNA polymerase (family 10)
MILTHNIMQSQRALQSESLLTRRNGEASLLSMAEPSDERTNQPPSDNHEVARVLHRIADLLEFQDENSFKLRAYRIAAETIEEMRSSVKELSARGPAELQKIPGIGKSISTQVIEILRTGTSATFEALKREIPETVLDLRLVAGVGLKTAQLLYRDFGISNLADFNAFAEGGGLHSVPGLGDKMIQRIQSSLARLTAQPSEQ